MNRTITHFMWSYQPHFCFSYEQAARRVFGALDSRFSPEVFLVGILESESPNRFPACVEPEDDFWIKSEDFNLVSRLAGSMISEYPESALYHSHPISQDGHDDWLRKRSIKDAVAQLINEHDGRPHGMVYFVSYPASVEGYLVSVVLGLQEEVLKTYASLTTAEGHIHEYRTVRLFTSLIDAVTVGFLDNATAELLKPEPGCNLHVAVNADQLIQSAGERLIRDAVWRADKDRYSGMEGLFRASNTVASLYYEKSAPKGTIVLAKNEHSALVKVVELETPVSIRDYRRARKLLQLTTPEIALHTDSEQIFGLVRTTDRDNQDEDMFTIRVLDHHYWEFAHGGRVLMQVRYGQPTLPKEKLNAKKLAVDLQRIFKDIRDEHVRDLVALARAASEEDHGTMLLISDAAEEEAQRLSAQAHTLVPVSLTPELLRPLTSIDGAVLLALDGACHAVGVILDGVATDKGNPARGARYNSALRYVEASERLCLAIVVSEDGDVTWVPDLRPPIRRSEVDKAIQELQNVYNTSPLRRRRFSQLRDWLEANSFYLLADDCETINRLTERIEQRSLGEDPTGLHVTHRHFEPDPEMDPSLYYTEA